MMKLLAGVEEVCDKETKNDESTCMLNNNDHEKKISSSEVTEARSRKVRSSISDKDQVHIQRSFFFWERNLRQESEKWKFKLHKREMWRCKRQISGFFSLQVFISFNIKMWKNGRLRFYDLLGFLTDTANNVFIIKVWPTIYKAC